jgi:hypothetical protein
MRGLVGVCAVALAALAASKAGAAVIFTDNFDAEPVPAAGWVPNDNSFAHFTVSQGAVDLLGPTNPFGLTGVGNFVDLDGSTMHGGFLQTIQQFSYNAGDTVTASFRVGGNQRGGTDGLLGGFVFAGPHDVTNVTTTGFTSTQTPGLELLGLASLGSTAAYQDFSISFRALSAGSLGAVVGTDSNDNIGPLLDAVTLSILVPEPASWALMILGFGGVGGVLRGRRTLPTAAG